MKNYAVVVAAGSGNRMGSATPKQYLLLNNTPILVHTLRRLSSMPGLSGIILVTGKDSVSYCEGEIVSKFSLGRVMRVIEGGEMRQDSVYNGLSVLQAFSPDIVMVHDGVRPFFSDRLFSELMDAAIQVGAAIPGVPIVSTVKSVSNELLVEKTIPRDKLWAVQTPQAFQYELLMQAYELVRKRNAVVTDEAMAVELLGHDVKMVKGDSENIKITTPVDLTIAQHILQQWEKEHCA
ncbi:MAG: 2-C-methyl-D-erythritol 4-phosphate cytidylyltransferase [Candidatus Auribacterota bacterium]